MNKEQIIQKYKEWTLEDYEGDFESDSDWRGDMVLAFILFCTKKQKATKSRGKDNE